MHAAYEKEIRNLTQNFDELFIYSADPGATAVLKPLHSISASDGKFVNWFVEGWAQRASLPNALSLETDIVNVPSLKTNAKAAIFMGQQVDFDLAYRRLAQFKERGFNTIFISDHWKDINKSFKLSETHELILPDLFLVPDDLAFRIQKKCLRQIGASNKQIYKVLRTFMHLGLLASIEKIENMTMLDVEPLKRKYNISGAERIIVMMLDCIEAEEKRKIGFDWRTSLKMAFEHFTLNETRSQLLIKPHPRQNISEVKQFVFECSQDERIRVVDEKEPEPLVLISDEVWGITTILLVLALKIGKPIKSFMPNRTTLGKKESNAHIEPFVLV